MKGVLLINLGSPDAATVPDVKKYLSEFLMDKYVIDIPYLVRLFLVRGVIIPKRVENSTKLYQSIWTKKGSPLIIHSKDLTKKVQERTELPVALGMRYGSPSIKDAIEELHQQQVDDIVVLPLYPQYAMSTTQTVMEKVKSIINKSYRHINYSEIAPFYNDEDYLNVLTKSIRIALNGVEFDHLLFSYHGIPERHIKKTDPTKSHCKIDGTCCSNASPAHKQCYRHQCYASTHLVAQKLGLEKSQYSLSFQSRLGKDPWLQPYTSKTLETLPKNGVKKLAVVTPAFVSDCLETIEEIGIEGREDFLKAGGEKFHRIDCLNSEDYWADIIIKWTTN